ncbi:RNA-directed DNA polymerase (Reverse transcriptase), Ribonuclease H [Gossypium australe]|uniref:RNA-directed DNA polymerase (Reverse transcriptase), Ribonuclease H n=1 Tax=Gossypium australe TaxID=47621 RepID=A0A5B6VEZ1_9ROSI|nr:RNA-directed DNA polymerase (Reverse transcriptase), Ribonuclease H [Gossypium australe]
MSVNIRPQYQTGTSAPTSFSTGSSSNPGDNPANPVVLDLDDIVEIKKTRVELPKQLKDRCRWLEEKFRAMENADYHCGIDVKDLSLVLDLVLPPKFKTPEFEKITLHNIEKKQNESFRQYAQRWREVATQVQPPLLEKETTMLFINTLKAPFINHMLGSATKSFSDMFHDPSGPNVAENPLPGHCDKGVNTIIENGGKRTKMDVEEVKTPLKWVWKKMVESGLITQGLGGKSRKAINYWEEKSVNTSKDGQDMGFYTRSGRRYDTPNTKSKLTYRDALIKVLKETYVANDISVNKLDHLVNNKSVNNFIFFNDDEMSSRVWTFDGTERRVIGRIEIPLLIGPSSYKVDLLVIDIKPSYNCLLGRPWIHTAEAVPSSLHQKLTLVTESQLVTINAEKDIIASVTSDAPYIGTDDEAIECSFRSLEFVNATFIVEGNKIPMPNFSNYKDGPATDSRERSFAGEMTGKIPTRKRTIHPERGMPREEIAEETLGNLNINAIFRERIWGENLADICSMSPDINDMSDAATNSESPFDSLIKEECKPVQQKLGRTRLDVLLKIKENVKKQFDAGFLQVVKYSEWEVNIILVPKKDGRLRMCVDYRDLNKASPKDNFLLPHIDTLVDNTAEVILCSDLNNPKIETILDVPHNLAYLKDGPSKVHDGVDYLNGRITRWKILLSEFYIVYVNQKAIKKSTIGDFLASRALEDYEPLNFDFSNEDLMYAATIEEYSQEGHPWKLNFDGASNVVGNGIGAILVSPNGDHYPFTSKLDFDCTNNMVEYEACIMGIHAVIEREIKVLELIEEFDDITFCYLPRDENQMDDALATLALVVKANKQDDVKPIQMSVYETPTHSYNIKEEEEDDHPWYHDILRYVKNHEYPSQATENDKRTLRRLANDYVLDGEILYKMRKDQVLLRCVDTVEAKKILEEVHEGVCGTHANGFTMARQIMRFGYYWSTMEADCISFAKKCRKCHIYGDKIHIPHSTFHVMTSP